MKISHALTLLMVLLGNHPREANSFAPIQVAGNLGQHRSLITSPHTSIPSSVTNAPSWGKEEGASAGASAALYMAGSEAEQQRTGPTVNIRLIGQSVANQALIGSTIWNGGAGYQVLTEMAHFNLPGILLGLAGAVPLLLFSQKVEKSESPLVAGLNLSTNMAVLRMFGSRPQPALTLGLSAFLGILTGVVEEVTFRGQILPRLAEWSANNVAIVGQTGTGLLVGAALSTIVFAALHTNPAGFFKGGEALADNLVLLCFQLISGSIFATLYLATHNLAVPIIAHALYDSYVFYNTHLDVAGQMQYAREEALMPVSPNNAVENKWKEEKGDQFIQSARETFYLMDTNQDGVVSRKELRVALFSYGINLSKLDSATVAKVADLDESGGIDFGEFLEFIGPAGSTNKAVRNALLGPV